MKNLLVLAVLFSLISCKGVEQYKGAIDELSSKWDTASSAVSEIGQLAANEESSMIKMLADMALAPEVLSKLKTEDQEKINSALQTCAQAGSGYQNIASEVSTFANDWASKAAGLTALKDGLAAGKIEGDVNAQISELTATVTDAMTKVEGWKTALATVKSGCDSNMSTYKSLLDTFAPAK